MSPKELAAEIQKMDYEWFLDEVLDRVPDNMDTRQGSIIYDAVAPASYVMAQLAMKLSDATMQTFTQTATGQFLDYKAEERGMSRVKATQAEAVGKFIDEMGEPLVPSVGDRFASIGEEPVYYIVTEVSDVAGTATLVADTAGEVGNSYTGRILPLSAISRFGDAEIAEITIPARDEETDDELRERLIRSNGVIKFGGNVADYIDFVTSMDDVSGVQVFPTWNGGGSVKVTILNNQFLAPSKELIAKVQARIDPMDSRGNGYGIAPVGHTVTVVAPDNFVVDVAAQVETESSVTIEDVRAAIEEAVALYFDSVRKKWGDMSEDERTYSTTLYRSQIIVALLSLDGVVNVNGVKFNGSEEDLTLQTDAKTQQLPILGKVVI